MRRRAFRFLILGGAFFSIATQSRAASAVPLLKLDASARSHALGKSQVVSSLGVEAVGANPAQIMIMEKPFEFTGSYSNVTDGVQYGNVGAALFRSRTKDRWVDAFGFAFSYLKSPSLDSRDASGNVTGSFGSMDQLICLGLSGDAGSQWKLGLTGKWIRSKISSYEIGNVLAVDLGAQYRFRFFNQGLSAGLSMNNLGPKVTYLSQKDNLPASLNLGLASEHGFLNGYFNFSHLMHEGVSAVGLGLEYSISKISLRAGYKSQGGSGTNYVLKNSGSFEKILGNMTMGIGLKLNTLRFDYSMGGQTPEYGLSHRVSLTLNWGDKPREHEPEIIKAPPSAPIGPKNRPAPAKKMPAPSRKK